MIYRAVIIASLLFGVAVHGAGSVPPVAANFLQSACMDCHDADTHKGNLDLSSLTFDLTSDNAFAMWIKVHDRVRDGEMPPKKSPQPDAAAVATFLKAIADPMIVADINRINTEGRSTYRRLNRYEYENIVRDLFSAPWMQVREFLPEDGESHRYNKSGDALSVSHVQMAGYLEAAEYSIRQAMASRLEKPETIHKRYYAREQSAFLSKLKFSQFNRSPERAVFPMLGTKAQPEVIDGTAPVTVGKKDPKTREVEAFGAVCSSYEPIELKFSQFVAPIAGHYKLRFNAYTFWAGPLSEKRWWTPDRNKTGPGRRNEPITIYSELPPRQLRWLGTFDVSPEPSVHELDVYLLQGESIRVDASRLFRSRPPAYHNPWAEKDGMPGVAWRWMEADGPLLDQWPPRGQQLMFGDLPMKSASTASLPVEVTPRDVHTDAERLLREFITAAYRAPVTDVDVKRFMAVIESSLKTGLDFTDSMVAGYSAVLCSPSMVCIDEQPGRLNDFALATRLSLFLWNSGPDTELRALAAKNELHQPKTLAAQIDRMLADPKSERFVESFLDYWLDLRKLSATAPDATLYPDYYLDDLLTESAGLETRAFFNELLQKNLPASNLVSSDFVMINERLARQYGIPGVNGVAIRRVQLQSNSMRGGLMTQAAVLKVTANGTTTSPVLRGVWIMERVLGKPPPPPPPSVPAIEPDTRGAVTIRTQLEKHRTQVSCAACHAKIDPAGLALESFDVMGGFRLKYRATGGDGVAVVGYGHNGQKFVFHDGQPVDPSGVLPDGRSFRDINALKKLLLADERQIARNLVGQLITFATGTPVRFGDRPAVEKILDAAAAEKYPIRSLIHGIVASDLFQMK